MQATLRVNRVLQTIGAVLNFIWYWVEVSIGFLYLILRSPLVFYRRLSAKAAPINQPFEIETDLTKIKLHTFDKCYETGEYQLLVISGTPTEKDMLRAWGVIVSKFQELAGDEQASAYTKQLALHNRLTAKITALHELLAILEAGYNTPIAECLSSEAKQLFQGGFSDMPFTRETYIKDIARFRTGLKRSELIRDKARRELDLIAQKNTNNGSKQSHIYENLFEIKKHEGLTQSPTELMQVLSVSDYAVYLKRWRAELEAQRRRAEREQRNK